MASEASSGFVVPDIESFDFVHFVIPDVNGIPRGQVIPKKSVKEKAEQGVDLIYAVLIMGPRCEYTLKIDELLKLNSQTWRPDLSTLIPTPWGDSGVCRTATVLCDLVTREGTVDELSTRHVVQRLVKRLKDKHGLTIRSAFEFEFSDTGEPAGSASHQLYDLRATEPDLDLFYELCEVLAKAGLDVTDVTPEFGAGTWELNFRPREGTETADLAFHVKNAVKTFFRRKGYDATFMTTPKLNATSCGLHFNHSLWSEDGRAVMKDGAKEHGLSDLALRWNAGLLAHAPAMAAICCPTVNCYRRMHGIVRPSLATWGVENRYALMRFKTGHDDVYLESRLPSSACNPYLVLAAHLAAGLDGLEAEMTSPPPMDTEHAQKLPSSLEEAVQALEKDDVMVEALGKRFVSWYVTAKRDYEIRPFTETEFSSEEEKMKFERERYFVSL
ncbi:hypothetical protein BaRGS_00005534 [Batillaria attramentaria]|uniref:Lengsin n=1 Tax=Batillaria attramentaria TaxID=370345 RepID=A0ABD0LUJ1_9CAEN